MSTSISINRAPVLTLWAAVVARRIGFDEVEALSLGKALAGLNAQAKGRRLGIFKPHKEKAKKAREKERGERFWIGVLGRPVPATNTDDGIRAVRGGRPLDPDGVRRYLSDKFGDDLKTVRCAQRWKSSPKPTDPRNSPTMPAPAQSFTGGLEDWTVHFVSQSLKPVKVRITAEHFGGRTTTHYLIVGRGPNESAYAVQLKAAAEYRRKFGCSSRIVAFAANCG
jgi:hypothetical protein